MNAAIIDEDIVHLEEGVLGSLLGVKADEGVAERVSGFPVPDDVAGCDLAKAGKDDFQVLLAQNPSMPWSTLIWRSSPWQARPL